jgi:NADPH-dependent glutamate synthase beta subunit-like oxidoreductase
VIAAPSDVNILIDRDKCFSCGVCVERCILDNLRMYLAPCRVACPIHTNCQGYVRLLAQGKEEEAAKELRAGLAFAGILGRVCPAPCEDHCERRKVDDQPVHIRALKRFLAEAQPSIVHSPAAESQETGKRVAIVGSGPAGLMAAYELAARGHGVTVFDAAAEPGGMLRWGIPAFRLPTAEVERSIRMLEQMRIAFQAGRALGKELDVEKLEREWDAVLLATGGGPAAKLDIPGEDLPGMYEGLALLRTVREGHAIALGERLVVIGGGNTAVDVALTCRKLGREVSLVCLEARHQMPAFKVEVEEALEESITIRNGWGPRRILRNGTRGLTIELSRCLSVFDEAGRFAPHLDEAVGLSLTAESVVVAIGQRRDSCGWPTDLRASNGDGVTDPLTMQTRRSKIFAAGDAVTGPRSVIEAMAQGREAAVSIHRLLSGETLRWGRPYWDGICITGFPIDTSSAVARPRAVLPRLPIPARNLRAEVEKTIDRKTAKAEAERCLNCGRPAEVNQTCWYCLPCEIECPADALKVRLPYLIR